MNRTTFAFLMAGIAVALLALMWLGWRKRTQRDAAVVIHQQAFVGALLAEFTGVQYVSTTLLGRPLERVAIAGLRYKGLAEIVFRLDGVTISITGEQPVMIPAVDVLAATRSSGRVGKFVESGGLSVLEWRTPGGQKLESGFRFSGPSEQRAFEAAVARLSPAGSDPDSTKDSSNFTDTTQEDA